MTDIEDFSTTNYKLLLTLTGKINCEKVQLLAKERLEGIYTNEEVKKKIEIISSFVTFKNIEDIKYEGRDFRWNTEWNTIKFKLEGGVKTRKRHGKEKEEKVPGFIEIGYADQDGKRFKITKKGVGRVFAYYLQVEWNRNESNLISE